MLFILICQKLDIYVNNSPFNVYNLIIYSCIEIIQGKENDKRKVSSRNLKYWQWLFQEGGMVCVVCAVLGSSWFYFISFKDTVSIWLKVWQFKYKHIFLNVGKHFSLNVNFPLHPFTQYLDGYKIIICFSGWMNSDIYNFKKNSSFHSCRASLIATPVVSSKMQ